MPGLPRLREAIAAQVARLHADAPAPDPATEITITAGATEALYAVLAAVVRPGDEVLVFEPAYDLYGPAIRLQGGVPRYVRLPAPHFRPDWDAVRRVVSPRTRLVIVNTPHNPSGAVFTADDWHELARLLDGTDALVLSDEVYEHLVFDGAPRMSARQHPALRERSFVLSSFGKTYHATGWKVGYCLAPPALTAEVRRVHQFLTFAVSTPTQHALADALEADPTDAHARGLAGFLPAKRDQFRSLLAGAGWDLLPVPGGYFQLARYDAFSPASDLGLPSTWPAKRAWPWCRFRPFTTMGLMTGWCGFASPRKPPRWKRRRRGCGRACEQIRRHAERSRSISRAPINYYCGKMLRLRSA